jgi:hypothetical protein
VSEATRAQHLAWCRQRAMELLDAGDRISAVNSLLSDLTKHEETLPTVPMIRRSANILIHGTQKDVAQFIEDCTEA